MANLFDVKQQKGETLKQYLARLNIVTLKVENPDQKFFMKDFRKGLLAWSFSDSLVLRWLRNMEQIYTWAKKHIEAKKDATHRKEVKWEIEKSNHRENNRPYNKTRPWGSYKGNRKRNWESILDFNPLKVLRGKILKEIHHTRLLNMPRPMDTQKGSMNDRWCEYHKTRDRDTKDYRTLKVEIEKLIKLGHLARYFDDKSNQNGRQRSHLT